MKMSFSLIAVLVLLKFASSALATDAPAETWEINGGTTGSYNHVFGTSNNDAQNSIGIIAGVANFLTPQLEFGFDGSFTYFSSGGSSISATILSVGPTYNFSTDSLNSFYVKGNVGIEIDDLGLPSSDTFTTFYYLVGFGRRVEIVSHVAWSPFLGFAGHTGSTKDDGYHLPSQTQIEVIPLQFSFEF